MKDLLTSIQTRRSYYGISAESPISDDRIIELLQEAVKHTPSAFNMQSHRAVLLLGKEHERFWQTVLDRLLAKSHSKSAAEIEEKIKRFAAGYGTVLFFDATEVLEKFGEESPRYKDKFSLWAQHANGMLQFAVWNLLEAEGFGASLQHYDPLIDEDVQKLWNVPPSWQLLAQMPFGKPTVQPNAKEFQPIEERFKVYR